MSVYAVVHMDPGFTDVRYITTLGRLPAAAVAWIRQFDRPRNGQFVFMEPLAPFELELRLPQEAVAAV